MSILEYFKDNAQTNRTDEEVVRTTLSELRPKMTSMQILHSTADFLFGEEYDDGLELTITLTERTLDTFTPKFIGKSIRECIRKHDNRFRILLLADYSETGRLHYHGIIKSKSGNPKGLDYIKRKLTHRFGRTELKPIRERVSWIAYMIKHYYKYDQAITMEDIITNDTSVFKIFAERKQVIDRDFLISITKRMHKFLNAP